MIHPLIRLLRTAPKPSIPRFDERRGLRYGGCSEEVCPQGSGMYKDRLGLLIVTSSIFKHFCSILFLSLRRLLKVIVRRKGAWANTLWRGRHLQTLPPKRPLRETSQSAPYLVMTTSCSTLNGLKQQPHVENLEWNVGTISTKTIIHVTSYNIYLISLNHG